MDLKLSSLHVVVTGASGGIGLETCRQYLAQGAKVTMHYNSNRTSLEPLLKQYPDHAIALSADVRKEGQVIELMAEAVERLGMISIIVINHGIEIQEDIPIHKLSLEQWNYTIGVNLTGSFLFAREFAKQLVAFADKMTEEERALTFVSLLTIGSTAGKFGEADHVDYSSTKSALQYGFMLSMKNELVRIFPRATANSIAPGWVHTPLAAPALARGAHRKAMKTTPLRKVGTVGEIATLILMSTSPVTGSHLSGNTLSADGGMEGRVLWTDEDVSSL